MGLPASGATWPPEEFVPAYEQMRVNDAWYTGDTDALHDVYSRGYQPRPSQYAGGIVGGLARMFWGRPQPRDQHRTRLHVPVPADLATTSADLLFSESPRFIMPGDQEKAQDRLEQIVNTPSVHASLLEAAEVSAALGGVYLRIVWDEDYTDRVMIDPVHADKAVPEWRWGRLTAVTFWETIEDDGKRVFRHLERHESGRILHGLYAGDQADLGKAIPLESHPATESYLDEVQTGVNGLTATYVPNIRPSRQWRGNSNLSPFGRSDFEGIAPLFDALDEVYSAWMRDIRLAKARLVVPQAMLDNRGRGQGAQFDDDQEIFSGMDMLGKVGDAGITAHQFDIRVSEHRESATEIMRAILRSAGYSASTFGDDPMAVSTTATEVKARERMSERTRDKKSRYWASSLGPFLRTLLEVDALVFRSGVMVSDIPQIKFQETTQKDPLELAQTANQLRASEAASTETLVRMLHPNWDGEAIDAEVARIDDRRGDVIDPVLLGRS